MCIHQDTKRILEMVKRDPKLNEVSESALWAAVNQAMRALPRIQAAERELWDSGQGPRVRGAETVEDEDVSYTFFQDDADRAAAEELNRDINGGDKTGPSAAERGASTGDEDEEISFSRPLWTRRRDPDSGKLESAREFHWFCVFRDLAPSRRSLAVVTALMREEKGTDKTGQGSAGVKRRRGRVSERVETMSANWLWGRRAKAWDDEQDRIRRRAVQQGQRTLREKQQQRLEDISASSAA